MLVSCGNEHQMRYKKNQFQIQISIKEIKSIIYRVLQELMVNSKKNELI